MKTIIFILAIGLLASCVDFHEYTIKITFCDNRPPKYVTRKRHHPPGNYEIETYKQAVPKWEGYLNVCSIESLGCK